MSSRTEILEQLYTSRGIIPLSHHEGVQTGIELENARKQYEEARKNSLRHQLARHYRVAIFGSARLKKESEEFIFISDLSKALVEARDVDIVTGGGPGIMEAAHFGARLAIEEASRNGKKLRSKNYGLTIDLPSKEPPNGHLHYERRHPEFSTRLQEFLDRSQGAYNAPGGIGTLLEQILLVQTRQVSHMEAGFEIVASNFWKPIFDALNDEMYHKRVANGRTPLISEQDLNLIRFTDNIPDIVDIFSNSYDNWWDKVRNRVRIVA